jgi:hypothetical protein
MGGAYGNLAALAACLEDAAQAGAEQRAFLGDAIGCCGHSEEVVATIRGRFDHVVAGNHEQQAVARAETCGCGYSAGLPRRHQPHLFLLLEPRADRPFLDHIGIDLSSRARESGARAPRTCSGARRLLCVEQ